MTEASIGKGVARARVMLTNLLGVVTLRPKKGGLESRAARKCAHPTGGNSLYCSNWCREGDFCFTESPSSDWGRCLSHWTSEPATRR